MIRRPTTRSVWLAFAFIDTSMLEMVSPQRKSAKASAGAFGASAGPMKARRKIDPPHITVRRVPIRRISRGTVTKPSMVPTGIPKRQKASVSTSSPSASFTSGMRGNQTESPSAFSAKTSCSGRRRGGSADIRTSGRCRRRLPWIPPAVQPAALSGRTTARLDSAATR